MDSWPAVVAVVVFFALRLGVPIAAMIGLGAALHRLDRRWQRQAEVEGLQALDVATPVAALATADVDVPCWEQKNCPQETRERCPATRNVALPCWLVRRDAEGCLPEACFACALFKQAKPFGHVPAAGDD
jgi:hypothetical protein